MAGSRGGYVLVIQRNAKPAWSAPWVFGPYSDRNEAVGDADAFLARLPPQRRKEYTVNVNHLEGRSTLETFSG